MLDHAICGIVPEYKYSAGTRCKIESSFFPKCRLCFHSVLSSAYDLRTLFNIFYIFLSISVK